MVTHRPDDVGPTLGIVTCTHNRLAFEHGEACDTDEWRGRWVHGDGVVCEALRPNLADALVTMGELAEHGKRMLVLEALGGEPLPRWEQRVAASENLYLKGAARTAVESLVRCGAPLPDQPNGACQFPLETTRNPYGWCCSDGHQWWPRFGTRERYLAGSPEVVRSWPGYGAEVVGS